MKILTICVPAYNIESYIEENLIKYGDLKERENLEVLVINDGSTDRTAEIAKKYQYLYPECIKVIEKENGGHGSALNCGIKYATGRYFCVVDGDDWVEPKALEKILKVLERKEFDAIAMNYKTVNDTTGEIKIRKEINGKKSFEELTIKEINEKNIFLPMAALCFKTKILKESPFRISEKIFYVDEEYCTIGISSVDSVLYLNVNFYCYRIGNENQSMSLKNQIKNIRHKEKILLKLIKFQKAVKLKAENNIYVQRKIVGIIKSIYGIMLMNNPDKKGGRNYIQYLNKKVLKEERLYLKQTKFVYFVFWLLSYIPFRDNIFTIYKKIKFNVSKKEKL